MEKVIVNYLKMETSYALLINGRRGIGKTFFVKDRIIPRVKKTEVFHVARKMYKPIYISLYGLKSMNEIFTLMAIEFMPWLNSKGAKIGLSIGKLVTRGLRYTVNYFKVSFGKQDRLQAAIEQIKGLEQLTIDADRRLSGRFDAIN